MIEYFCLQPLHYGPLAARHKNKPHDVELVPVTSGWNQHRSLRRKSDFAFEVSHHKREEHIIGSFVGRVFHNSLRDEFDRRGFTGCRLRPAAVRFRDGHLSAEDAELAVTALKYGQPLGLE